MAKILKECCLLPRSGATINKLLIINRRKDFRYGIIEDIVIGGVEVLLDLTTYLFFCSRYQLTEIFDFLRRL